MEQRQGIIVSLTGRRGRGPGYLTFDDGSEIGSFEPALLKTAAANINATVDYTWEEKPGKKDPKKVYKTLLSLTVVKAAEPPLEGTIVETLPSHPIQEGKVLALAKSGPLAAHRSGIADLEEGFAMAVRQRELMEEFIRSRFREGEHYMDGATFGSKKKVLLQPGAQLIHYCHGHSVDFEILAGPMAAQDPGAKYTLVIKAKVSRREQVQGHGLGSCSSLIWSGREMRLKDRAVSPDLTHNTTLKMAKKRALVDSCLNTTAAAEFFTQDLDEYIDQQKDQEGGAQSERAKPRFIKP